MLNYLQRLNLIVEFDASRAARFSSFIFPVETFTGPCFFNLVQILYLEITLCLAAHVFLRNVLPLVVELLTFGKCNLHLHEASLQIYLHRNQRVALLCKLSRQLPDL